MIDLPVFIISRDRLTWLRETVAMLKRFPGLMPIILDNASTYLPLLAWFEEEDCPPVIRLPHNYGCRVPWVNMNGVSQHIINNVQGERKGRLKEDGTIVECVFKSNCFEDLGHGYYVVMDNDLDLRGVPEDGFEVLRQVFDVKHPAVKVGFSIDLDSVSKDYELHDQVLEWETQFSNSVRLELFRVDNNEMVEYHDCDSQMIQIFRSDIDTTTAIYNLSRPMRPDLCGPAWRTGWPYQQIHRPWTMGIKDWTEEDWYYHERAAGRTMWTENMQIYCKARGIVR